LNLTRCDAKKISPQTEGPKCKLTASDNNDVIKKDRCFTTTAMDTAIVTNTNKRDTVEDNKNCKYSSIPSTNMELTVAAVAQHISHGTLFGYSEHVHSLFIQHLSQTVYCQR